MCSRLRGSLPDVMHGAPRAQTAAPGIADNARVMLAASTSGDLEVLALAIEKFGDACTAAGY